MRILVVDDRPLGARKLRDDILSAEPEYHVEVATGEGQAVARATQVVQAARERFDVFLIDDNLGAGLNGSELMAELRQLSPSSEAIIFTAYADETGKQRAIEAGARAYISRPINEKEVLWQLRGMLKERTVRRERDWLQLLALMTEHLQRVSSTREAGDAIVEGVRRLGFQRARLRMVVGGHDEQLELIGVSQMGNIGFQDDYSTVRRSLRDLPYSRRVLVETGKPTLFHSRELGNAPWDEFIGPPKDEWFKVPLFVGQESIGTLSLDNGTDPCKYSVAERELLQQLLDQFGRQAATALERVRRHEKTEQEAETEKFVNQVSRAVTEQAAKGDLNELLNVLREQIHKHLLLDVDSFEVALLSTSRTVGRYLDFFYVFREGERQLRCWSELGDDSTPKWMIQLIEDGQARKDPKGQQLGIPLKLQDEVIGVVLVNVERVDEALYHQKCNQLAAVVTHVAGLIRAVYEAEREKERSRRKEHREKLIEKLPELARANENHFLHAVLTYSTHGQCLSFNRAVLFRFGASGHSVQGRMGIGHLERRLWEEDVTGGEDLSFADYLSLPYIGQLHATPLATATLNWQYDLGNDYQNPFRRVYMQGTSQLFAAADLERWLPGQEVITKEMHTTAQCALVPWKDGQEVVGVVLVDNAMDNKPIRQEDLTALEELLIQASQFLGDAGERMRLQRQGESNERILQLEQRLMTQATEANLKDLLRRLCQEILDITKADFVVLYPLKPGGMAFDTEAIAFAGTLRDSKYLVDNTPRSEGVAAYVLRNGTLAINDVARSDLVFSGARLSQQRYVVREKIAAFIGTPIRVEAIATSLGVLYLDYRQLQNFSEADVWQAEQLARVAGTLIGSEYGVGQKIERVTRRWSELQRAIQEESLEADTTEERVIKVVFGRDPELFDSQAKPILALREWETDENQETIKEIFRYYQWHPLTKYEDANPSDKTREIVGKAFEEGETVLLDNMLVVPIKTSYRTMGCISIAGSADSLEPRFHQLADTIATALDNVRRQKRLHAVLEAAQQVVAPTNLKQTLKDVITAARKASQGLGCVTLWYCDPTSKKHLLGAKWGLVPNSLSPADTKDAGAQEQQPIIEYVMDLPSPLWAEDLQDGKLDQRLRESNFVKEQGLASVAAFPLRVEDECIGALFLNYRHPHRFSPGERDALTTFAVIAATSIRHAQSLEQARQGERRLQVALKVVDAVGTELNPDEVLRQVLTELKKHFDKEDTEVQPYVMRYDNRDDSLYLPEIAREFHPVDNLLYKDELRLSLDGTKGGIVCRVAREALDIGDVHAQLFLDIRDEKDYLNFNSRTVRLLCAGLVSREESKDEKRLWGILAVSGPEELEFSEQDKQLLELVARQALLAMERAEQHVSRRRLGLLAWRSEITHRFAKVLHVLEPAVSWLSREDSLSNIGKEWVTQIANFIVPLQEMLVTTPPNIQIIELLELLPEIRAWIRQNNEWSEIIYNDQILATHTGIRADRMLLMGCLHILIRNAAEAMKYNGTMNLIIRELGNQAIVEIEIRDTGPGMPPEYRSNIGRMHLSSKGEDRGQGLVNATALMEMMNGSLCLLPEEPGCGARLALRIPKANASE